MSERWRLSGLLFVVVAILWAPGSTRAQDEVVPWSVELVLPECEDLPFERGPLFRLVKLELESDGVADVRLDAEADGMNVAALIDVQTSCERETHGVRVQLTHLASGRTIRQSLDLSQVARESRPRFLALGIAELLRGGWASLERTPPLDTASDDGAVPTVERGVRTEAPRSDQAPPVALLAGASMRVFPGTSTALYGGRVGLAWVPTGAPLVIWCDLGFHYAHQRVELGDVALGAVGLSAAATWLIDLETVTVHIGPTATVSWAWTSGQAHEGAVEGPGGGAPVVHAGLSLGSRLRLTRGWALLLRAEAGLVLAGLGANADGQPVAAMDGLALSLVAGLTVDL